MSENIGSGWNDTPSDEIQEILGYIPRRIVRSGISVFFGIILLLFLSSWFFKYPDVIKSSIVLTTQTPPVTIIARSSGKIQRLFVLDRQNVKTGDVLGVIENTARYEDVVEIGELLSAFQTDFIARPETAVELSRFRSRPVLGELQSFYEIFLRACLDYRSFVRRDLPNKKIASLKEEVRNNGILMESVDHRIRLLQEEYTLAKNQYERARQLNETGIISSYELDAAKAVFLQKEYALESAKSEKINVNINAARLQQSIEELDLGFGEAHDQLRQDVLKTVNTLISQVSSWHQNYVLATPIEGIVTFNKFWSANQHVQSGNAIMTVVPNDQENMVGKVMLPILGSGKVNPGQKVIIKFENFPFQQYGMVEGIVLAKSLVPEGNQYAVEVGLPSRLKTNFGKSLEFSQEMQGTAEIITEDIRLIERFLSPFKVILAKYASQD